VVFAFIAIDTLYSFTLFSLAHCSIRQVDVVTAGAPSYSASLKLLRVLGPALLCERTQTVQRGEVIVTSPVADERFAVGFDEMDAP
jgi:hypothetical protein